MKFKVKYFGQIAEITGVSQVEFNNIKDIDSLRIKIFEEYPELQKIKFKISVNNKLIDNNQILEPNCEVAFLPPFAGG